MSIGVVYGRRRAGKSFLLRRLVGDGVYHQAIEEGRSPALDRLASVVAERVDLPSSAVRFTTWLQAFEALLRPPTPGVVVLDELPYLTRYSPELVSSLQRVYDDHRRGPPIRLLLCGSSLSVMSTLLAGSQPLRGRASLDLRVDLFDYRTARLFWRIRDFRTALAVDAILGGAAGYRDLIEQPPPQSPDDIGTWLGASVLNPSHALYREDEYLLREDPRLTDRALYQSLLSAVASGERTPTRIGGRLGKERTALGHLLDVLTQSGYLRKDVDLGNSRSVAYMIADPLIRFSSLIVAPNRMQLDERRWREVWRGAQDTWRAQILGPHFEDVARLWLRRYASPETIGGVPTRIGRLTIADKRQRTAIELDTVAVDAHNRPLILGEAKATAHERGTDDLARLEQARSLLGPDAANAKLLLASASGFTAQLRSAAKRRSDVELADLQRLYEGD